ncbi:MAG TPA: sulfurtransferase [Gammaproteobacteria bacterium]|nr:sulfurtransferase [Gammaproteobacteria bacterium]
MPWLINAAQLDKFRKNQKNILIFDTSWHLPNENRDPKQEFIAKHIIGARFLDIELFHDKEMTLPNMLIRDEKCIGEKIGELGITNDQKIIFYDQSNLHTSCRALWMFKVFGYNPSQLYILDGGFKAWEAFSGKTESGEIRNFASKSYTMNFDARFIRTLMQMKSNLHHPTEQVVDMRHPVRFAGGPETRAELRSGHIPGSFSFPYMTMFEAEGRFKPLEKIRKQLTGIGVDLSCPVIALCGSGITASILNFVLDLINHPQHSLYDGSWSEWGASQLYVGENSLDDRPVIRSVD